MFVVLSYLLSHFPGSRAAFLTVIETHGSSCPCGSSYHVFLTTPEANTGKFLKHWFQSDNNSATACPCEWHFKKRKVDLPSTAVRGSAKGSCCLTFPRGWVSLMCAAGLHPCRIVLLELFTHGGLRMRKAKEPVGGVLMSQVNPLEAKEPWYLQM